MTNLPIKYKTYSIATPPRPIKIEVGGWSGTAAKMVDGSDPQPWHCLPFVEGATYGLELIYPYETACDIVNDNGTVRIQWEFAKEPNGALTGFEFLLFSPVKAAKYYLFNTRIDIQAPPGHVLRTEPHPRYFTDDTGEFPLALIGHLQNEWYPRLTFVVFRAPWPGQRHVFRKGQPFAQVLFVPKQPNYELVEMTAEEAERRQGLEKAIRESRMEIAENHWQHPDNVQFNNHYKLLARAFTRDGMAGIEKTVREAVERRDQSLPKNLSVAEYLAIGRKFLDERKYEDAHRAYGEAYRLDPRSADALTHLGVCFAMFNSAVKGIELMSAAAALEPRVPYYHSNLAELMRRMGRFQEAEHSIRAAVALDPNNPGYVGLLAVILAQQGRTDEAMLAHRAASSQGRPAPQTHLRMGTLLADHGALADARVCFEAALALDPDFVPAQQALSQLNAQAPSR